MKKSSSREFFYVDKPAVQVYLHKPGTGVPWKGAVEGVSVEALE